jgi:hypothetical protein
MRILVACEFSGVVRDAFLKKGHNVMSCDLSPTERPGPHYCGDVEPLLKQRWDLLIAHPPCTFLCNSGVRWLYEIPGRWAKMKLASQFFLNCLNANAEFVCVENPIPHKHAKKIICKPYNQIIQPWQFGHGETKSTCLWLKNLPLLRPTKVVDGRYHRIHEMSPGLNRSKLRSVTYEGIAAAFADQWGDL